jgi:error-prone DNA polymerase
VRVPTYVELRAHTGFSFGDGAVTPESLVARAAALGYRAIGITDTADLGGIVRAHLEAKRQGISLIAGAELRVDGRPLALLARTAEGCRNLAALITHSRVGTLRTWTKTHTGRPRGLPNLTWEQVAECSAGLHLLTGPASGTIATAVRERRLNTAERLIGEWRESFEGHIAIEVQQHRTGSDESALAGALVQLATHTDVPWVVTNDPRYLDPDTRLVHDILTALRSNTDLDSAAARGLLHPNGEWLLYSPREMAIRWVGCEAGLHESARIASECNFDIRWLRPPLPSFPSDPGLDVDATLRRRVYQGAQQRWKTITDAHHTQLEHELDVITKLGFSGFFLVMWDAVRFARDERNILCQGRGSAASSAVAYCLGVTAVDPIEHGLLFERFLSDIRLPGKSGDYTEAPDIDVDIEHNRREEVLDYVYGKYQRDRSAITCIVQTYRAPNAVLDAMRALGYPIELARNLSKRLHRYDPTDGAAVLQSSLAKKFALDLTTTRGQALITAMRALDGLPRLRSTHVGGFVLSSAPLGQYLPIEHTTMGRTIIQFDKDDLDAIGVPKFDFLGLGALTHVRHAFDEILHRTGRALDLYNIPPNDPATFALIASGDTLGTFQIESRAQIASILHTRPELLYDIVVQIALVRPGPIQGNFVHPYTRRRRGEETATYLHPLIEPILKRTYGVPIFQEQAMAISIALGGFTPAEADQLRRTMGNIRKKGALQTVLTQLQQHMIDNSAVEPRISPSVAEQIGRDLLTFANYGFPESHAWSFAFIAYATAYLKQHYPTDFYLGLLKAQPMGFYQPSTLIHDARRHGVEVRPPSLCDGGASCTTEPTTDPLRPALRIGWKHIRGVASQTIERLEQTRTFAPFTSIADVIQRVGMTRTEALQFARADAFHAWEPDRRRAAWEALRVAGDTYPLAPPHHTPYQPRSLDDRELIFLDYHATGICIAGHPIQHLRDRLQTAGVTDSQQLTQLRNGSPVVIAGLVTVRQRPPSAKGTIFLLLEDEFGFMNVIASPTFVEKYTDVVKFAPFVVVQGRLERDGAAMNVIGTQFRELRVTERLSHEVHSFH